MTLKLTLTLSAILFPLLLCLSCHFDRQSSQALAVSVMPQTGPWEPDEIHLTQLRDHFHVVLTNISNRPQKVWKEWCSWGYFALTFEVTDENGTKTYVHKKPVAWTFNSPDPVILLPQQQIVFDVSFNSDTWENSKRHYGTSYEFGGDVDEMLRDYSHYVFSFHDQFVEVICAGIWFETAEQCIGNREPDSSHPLLDLPTSSVIDRIEGSGIACQVRGNPRKLDDLVRDAALCSQKLLQFAAELDGSASVSWTLDLRVRAGLSQSSLRGYFGNVEKRYEGIATLADVRPHIEGWLREVAARRRAMGKA